MLQGLCQFYRGNLYRNIRYVDDEKTQKCVLPCTPLAIVKILEHLGVYDKTYVLLCHYFSIACPLAVRIHFRLTFAMRITSTASQSATISRAWTSR